MSRIQFIDESKRKKDFFLPLILVVIFIILAMLGTVWFFWNLNSEKKPNMVVNQSQSPVITHLIQ